MKILVIGGAGRIGSKIVKELKYEKNDVISTYLNNKLNEGTELKLDIVDKDKTKKLISMVNPEIVIHTASITNVDLCERDRKLADLINIKGTENVIHGCQEINCKLVYLSTSFVFDGKKENYSEDDSPSPATYYGVTKFKGEELVKKSKLPYLILRTDQPYDWKEKWQLTNSVLRVLETLQKGKILNEIIDWYNVPTYLPDFTNALKNLIKLKLTGVFHVCGSSFVNRYDWAMLTAEIFGFNKNLIKPIKSEILNLPAKRVNVNLKNEKLFNQTGIKMRGIDEGLKSMKEMMGKENNLF